MVKNEGKKVVARIGENPDYQVAKEAFTSEVKSVEDEDYSIEEALQDINLQSNLVEEFQQDSPFHQERERLEQKIKFIKQQIKILEAAYQSFPRRKKNIKDIISDIEKQEVKKSILPDTYHKIEEDEPHQIDEDERD